MFRTRKFTAVLGNEEIPTTTQWTSDEQKCEDHFKGTTRRNSAGRFVVKIPFKEDAKSMSDSYQQAKRRLGSLIFRLENNQIYTTDIVSSFTNSFKLDIWKKFSEINFKCLLQIVSNCHIMVSSKTSAAKLNWESYWTPQPVEYLQTTIWWLALKFKGSCLELWFYFGFIK